MGQSPSPQADVTVVEGGPPAARRTLWGFRRRRLADLGTWPFRVGICAVLAVLSGLAALQQRGALDPPQWTVIALVGLAVLPWLVDLLIAVPPPWIFAPAVILPVTILHDPTGLDPLGFLVAILALDMGLQLGPARSAPIPLAGAGIVAWQVASVATGPTRSLVGLVGGIAAGWLIGLALHSQVQRVARLRRAQQAVAGAAAAAERARTHRDVDVLLRHRVDALAAELAAIRAQVDRDGDAGLAQRLTGAERQARDLLADLDAQVGAPAAASDGHHGQPRATRSRRR